MSICLYDALDHLGQFIRQLVHFFFIFSYSDISGQCAMLQTNLAGNLIAHIQDLMTIDEKLLYS